ncbi:hypothetical protein QC761_0097380 [Podospora bellae-mahoneyi]|uniref:Uncharacterized protein n=1 Tax=Podospora bellae-mahoneyi TaxID=2093777 RepID=A0ABR0FAG0_9PEZI|nr:hypothetical protein QC761_0097380 [Podospora bellae-mahoneyi]
MARHLNLLLLMGVSLVMDNIIDKCAMDDVLTLYRTQRFLNDYISTYLARRARRKFTREGLKVALIFVRLCDMARHCQLEHLTSQDTKLAIQILDEEQDLLSITTPRILFDLCRVEELAARFVRFVLRIQRRLADKAERWIRVEEPAWLAPMWKPKYRYFDKRVYEEKLRTLSAAVGSHRRPLSKTEVARLERAFVRAELLFFLHAVFSKDITDRAFHKLHRWEVEELLCALDFMECQGLRRLTHDTRTKALRWLFRYQISQAFYRRFYDKHYASRQQRLRFTDVPFNHDDHSNLSQVQGQDHSDDIKWNVPKRTDPLGPNAAWSAYASQFPIQVEDRNNTRMTLSQPRFFRAPGIYEDFVCIQNYRCLAWVMWDADTTAALQLGSVETTTSQMPPPVLQLVNLAKALGKNSYERFLESTGKIKYSPLQLYDLGLDSQVLDPGQIPEIPVVQKAIRDQDVRKAVAEF